MFIRKGKEEGEALAKAKQLMMYSVVTFFVMMLLLVIIYLPSNLFGVYSTF